MRHSQLRQGIWPLIVMLLFLGAILLANQGIPLQARPAMLSYLNAEETPSIEAQESPEVMIVCNPDVAAETACASAMEGALDQIHTPWTQVSSQEEAYQSLDGIKVLLICSQQLTGLATYAQPLLDWVDAGGRLGFLMALQDNRDFDIISHRLGIMEHGNQYRQFTSLLFQSDLLPLWDSGEVYTADGAILDYALTVHLENDCRVYLTTGDEAAIPLLWTRDLGKGRVLMQNNTLVQNKDSRGLALESYLLLRDTVVYPIINAGMVFIDDFPAPQPEGTNEALLQQYGYDIQGFYRNHWWPDMKSLAWKYGLRYTGVLIETYNDRVTGPFQPDTEEDSLIRYYASELLQSGGEIGLHGYNHMPLCPDGFAYAGENYVTWPTGEDMAASLRELLRYGSRFLTGTAFQTYVPPSNYLSDEGKAVLLATLPQVRTLSGLYYPEVGVNALIQEFQEETDGSVSVPRITSGFILDQYNRLKMAQEMLLHGVLSHFIHPDDVLDSERGAQQGWSEMIERFSATVDSIAKAYPALRWSTASEGAAAVQRYDRLRVQSTEEPDGLSLSLTPFYTEAWLAVKTEHTIASVEGGEAYAISDGFYWVRADAAQVRIVWGDGT